MATQRGSTMSEVLVPAAAKTPATKLETGHMELSVIIPTFNERANVAAVIERLSATLTGISWEAIFVDDDSTDGTAAAIKVIAARDPRIRCLRRVSRRGLAGACIDGILFSSAPYVAVMDADLQHDETLLPRMLETLQAGGADLVVGTRYPTDDGIQGFSKVRAAISRVATLLAQRVGRVSLADPMSGFFMIRRECFDPIADKLATQGFKILLDIVITARGRMRVAELPYVFAARTHGESKLDPQVAMDFIGLLLSKATGGAVTPRFLSFAFVGVVGLGVHLAVLRAAMLTTGLDFTAAQTIATLTAMTGNFLLNNVLTYRDRQLSGLPMLRGLLGFYAVSAFGAVANVGVATWLYTSAPVWWLAGAAGALMSAVWNYSMSTLLVWRVK
jgi:dolichol-phosphate mannosyltransferase